MFRPFRHRLPAGISALLALGQAAAVAGVLYRTDFETFASGNDKWVGTDGWIGNCTGLGVHGIDQDVIPGGGMGKTAFIGFSQPSATLAFVAKPIHYSPQPGDLPMVRVETLVGIQDSVAKAARDSFFVSIYNSAGGYLAGIRFDNRTATYGIWRADGANADHDTGMIFYRGELHLLSLEIHLPTNRWSAELDGIPLFANAPFTATTRPVAFGFLAYEWQLGAATAAGYGDNWMMVADTVVRSVPLAIEPFRLTAFTRSAAGATLAWPGQKGFDYQIEYSRDLVTWYRDLPGAVFAGLTADQPLTFHDPAAAGAAGRFYRVGRSESP